MGEREWGRERVGGDRKETGGRRGGSEYKNVIKTAIGMLKLKTTKC